MISEDSIKVVNQCGNISNEYEIKYLEKMLDNNLEMISGNKADESRISNIKIKEDYIITISTNISKKVLETNASSDKNVNIIGFDIKIIKLNLNTDKKDEDKKEININIPLKETKVVANNNLIYKYFFYDFIKINENISYLHIYIFGQLHIYKIYLKENQLKYNKIELKKFNEKTKVLYLGECYKSVENILEIALLLKPSNSFMFLEIETKEKGSKIQEKKYDFKCQNAKNILYKYIRSYCGIFLFSEKESNKKYIIYKDGSNSEIQMKEALVTIADNFNNYFYSISNKLYLISELAPEKEEENDSDYIILGIYSLYYEEENEMYNSKLLQKIIIPSEGGIKDYNISVNCLNYISIQFGGVLYFIHLDENSSVDKINKLYLNSKDSKISKIISDKSNDWTIFVVYINSKVYYSKFYDDKENYSKGKCLINGNDFSREEGDDKEEEKEFSEIEDKESERFSEESNKIKEKTMEKENNINCVELLNEDFIQKIIKERIKFNDEKIERLKKEYDCKIEMIQKDIELQGKENEKLENSVKDILFHINELQKLNINEEDEKENANSNYKRKNNFYKNDVMNYYQYNSLKQWNQMKMMSQFNLINPENMLNNSQIKDPRFFQFILQNKASMNQMNNFFKKKINQNNETPLNIFNIP